MNIIGTYEVKCMKISPSVKIIREKIKNKRKFLRKTSFQKHRFSYFVIFQLRITAQTFEFVVKRL